MHTEISSIILLFVQIVYTHEVYKLPSITSETHINFHYVQLSTKICDHTPPSFQRLFSLGKVF